MRLGKDPHSISLGEVVRATESAFQKKDDKKGKADAPVSEDYLDMVDGAFLAFVEFLDQKSIADLAELGDDAGPEKCSSKEDRPEAAGS